LRIKTNKNMSELKEGYQEEIDRINKTLPEGSKLTPQRQRKNILILLVGIVGIFFLVKTIIGGGKPSECDCRKVMLYEEGAVQSAKKILGNEYGADFMERSQRRCGLKYWDDIDQWQTAKGLIGTPNDNAMEFFIEKCK
jgi:hypothetical protein